MREILEKYEQRQLHIVEELYFAHDWITVSFLAKKLGCSERTIKQDVCSLKELVTTNYLQTSQKGIRLSLPSHMSIEKIYRTILKGSANFNFIKLLFHDGTKTLEQMADFLYTSPATLARTIKRINLALEKFSLQIKTNPCRLIGPESNIRSFYICLFKESYTYLEWPYPEIDQKTFEKFLLVAGKFARVPLDFSDFEDLKHWIAVSMIRAQKGYYVEIKENKLMNYRRDLEKFHLILKPMEQKLNLSFHPELIEQTFAFFLNNGIVFCYDDLLNLSQLDLEANLSTKLWSGLLDSLSHQVDVPIPNKEHLLLDLYNGSRLATNFNKKKKTVTFILFDQKGFFVRSLEDVIPEFLQLVRSKIEEYQEKMNVVFSDHHKNELLYTLVIHWDNLLIELHKKRKKAKVLIISNYDLEHANLIRSIVNIHYGSAIEAEIYVQPRLCLKKLRKMDYDVLITTTSFDPIPGKKIICIQNIPTEQNLKDIEAAILEVRKPDTRLRYAQGNEVYTTEEIFLEMRNEA